MLKGDGRIRAIHRKNALDTQTNLGVCEHEKQQFVADRDL